MAETLRQVAQLCPTVRRIILLGPPQEGFVSFQQMIQDSGDLFNENLDVRSLVVTLLWNLAYYYFWQKKMNLNFLK